MVAGGDVPNARPVLPRLAKIVGTIAFALGPLAIVSMYRSRRIERLSPATGTFITVDDVRWHYVERGHGPTIVMIHGLAGQSGNFTHSLVDRLTDDFRVIAIDRVGSGYSSRRRGAPANVLHQAADIAALFAALSLERPFIVGHSLGGAIALALALDHSEVISGVALIAPYTHAQKSAPAAFTSLAIRARWMRRLIAHVIVPFAMQRRRSIREAIFRPDAPPHDFDTLGGGMLAWRPSAFIAASEDLLASNRDLRALAARYASLRVPTSVLFGTDDNVLDHRVHGLSIREKNPSIDVTLVDGGHMLPISAPHATAAWIRTRADAALD